MPTCGWCKAARADPLPKSRACRPAWRTAPAPYPVWPAPGASSRTPFNVNTADAPCALSCRDLPGRMIGAIGFRCWPDARCGRRITRRLPTARLACRSARRSSWARMSMKSSVSPKAWSVPAAMGWPSLPPVTRWQFSLTRQVKRRDWSVRRAGPASKLRTLAKSSRCCSNAAPARPAAFPLSLRHKSARSWSRFSPARTP